MKRNLIIFGSVFLLAACGRESSPDGRAQIRDGKLQMEINDLKHRDDRLHDSLVVINNNLNKLKLR